VSASVRFVYHGLEEFKRELRNMPEAFAQLAYDRAVARGEEARATVARAYTVKDGDLVDGLSLVKRRTRAGVSVTLKNKAHHAWLYDNGSQTRQNRFGANRGRMPAKHVFDSEMVRARLAYVEDLKEILRAAGLKVRGDV